MGVNGLIQLLPSGGILDIAAILRSERDRVARQLEGLNAALAAFAGSYVGKTNGGRGRRTLTAAARTRIAAAQRARWAKIKDRRVGTSATTGARKAKRTMSVAAKAKIAAAQRARWAKIKKGSKTK
ncbi:MAG: hypothetical protein DMG90_09825 [Acidobacteria bacterium]|nr:MAG: hypothetical protein DMG90_09825 [Acidobacteriota bacterium]